MAEDKGTPVRRWYASYTPDGSLWCESSDPAEVLERSRGRGCTYAVIVTYERHVREPWDPEADDE